MKGMPLLCCVTRTTLATIISSLRARLALSHVFLLLCRLDGFPNDSSQSTTDEGTYDEDPQVGECGTALEDGRSQRTGRVHGSACVADANQMNQYEAQTDSQTGEVVGSAIGLGGSSEHYEHEDTGEDDLSQQTAQH